MSYHQKICHNIKKSESTSRGQEVCHNVKTYGKYIMMSKGTPLTSQRGVITSQSIESKSWCENVRHGIKNYSYLPLFE